MKKFLIPFFSIILVLSFLIAGCSSNSTTTKTSAPVTTSKPATTTTAATTLTPQYGGTLRIIDSRGPSTTLGWYAEAGAQYLAPAYPCIEPLLRVTFENKVIPWLAQSYQVADDLKSITFNIRQGVKFQDGSDFNGAVAKWNLDMQIAANVSASAPWASVDLVDPYTIRLNLKYWNNDILNTLASAAGTIVSQAAYNSVGKEGLRWNPVGTGAFKFVSFQKGVSVKYTKNPNYWGKDKGLPYLDGVEYSFITDPMTQEAAIQSGEADTLGDNVGQAMADLLQSQKGSSLMYNPSGIADMTSDSANSDSPFSKLQVRQAVDCAIDRDAIVKVRGFGYSQTDYQFCYPGTPAYITNLKNRTYDTAIAKQLLAAAGYPNGFSTNMWVDSSSADKDSFTSIQNYLSAVGINAQFFWADNPTITSMRSAGWKNGLMCGILGLDANENDSFARYFIKATPFYPCIIKTDAFDALYQTSLASKAYDPAQVQKMVQSVYDNALSNCLWTVNHANLIQPYVHGAGFMSMQTWPGWTPESAWMSKH